jgi:hypothetical protein
LEQPSFLFVCKACSQSSTVEKPRELRDFEALFHVESAICIFKIVFAEKLKLSEVLEEYIKRKVDYKLKVCSEAPLTYVRQQVDLANEILLCVEIPWPLLNIWKSILEGASGKDANYIDLLNLTVADKWFVLKRDNQRVEELLRNKCNSVSYICRKTKGRKRQALNDNVYKLSVKRGEIETIDQLKSEVEMVNKEFDDFKVKYNDLEKQKNALYEEMILEINSLKEEVCNLKWQSP